MNDYRERVGEVCKFIDAHLDHKLSLDQLAELSHFSKYHFSRIFASVTGDTPFAYITKQRLARAAGCLLETDKSVLEIALLCGFESASNFNAAFKKHFGQTPTGMREQTRQDRNISLSDRNPGEAGQTPTLYDQTVKHSFLRRVWQMQATIEELPLLEVAYVRHVGSYLETYRAWAQLGKWAAQHRLFPPEQSFIGISLDDPAVTEEEECRYDACVTVPNTLSRADAPQEIRFQTLPGGLYAKFYFYDTPDKLALLYQSIFGNWLPDSAYDPDDRYCLEFSMNDPAQDPQGKAKVDLYIPIRTRT
ncbi:MAG: AraC family transcriptional regulator [Paenibacillaceae bacterium]|uniref:AraC family transcriptional regulator n=1 Tax=Paenibacillus mellifer TaxID=2937794 RepID=A0A9X1XX90_9BACL|nr:AraC family transcriptional regulator [Paenibacillus mellifer]MBW4840987.1 AraC family transcriptional regulator [Paenibacillaceae bacterium]MCK8487690.1 AraC family transcriptional regulator [Paenibacillus mellifer]